MGRRLERRRPREQGLRREEEGGSDVRAMAVSGARADARGAGVSWAAGRLKRGRGSGPVQRGLGHRGGRQGGAGPSAERGPS